MYDGSGECFGFRVRDFGAVGDGKTNDTAAIQRTIDTCAQAGGGMVVLHNGAFLTDTLSLRSHVELHLASTAVLLGSTEWDAYRADPKAVFTIVSRSLIHAEGCEDIAITGSGTIDGQGHLFCDRMKQALGPRWWRPAEATPRPILIRLRKCRNVRLEGVLLRNSPAFCVTPTHCRQVRIDGLRIESEVAPNNDGLHIVGCEGVFISNCDIRSGDDCIALYAYEGAFCTRDVVITNCLLRSRCAAIRIGPCAEHDVERVAVSNCVIRDTRWNGIKIQQAMGAVMRDMTFSNLVMDNVGGPISIRLAGWKQGDPTNPWSLLDDSRWEQGELRNILFQNIRARAADEPRRLGISITGTPRTRPRDIAFSDVDITFPGGGTAEEGARRSVPDMERDYPECYMFGVLPAYGLYVHHATGLSLNNVRFRLAAEDARPAVVCDDVEDLELAGFRADGHHKMGSLIRLQDVRAAFITGARVLDPVGTFLRAEGGATKRIILKGNDLALAREEVAVSEDLPPGAVLTDAGPTPWPPATAPDSG